MHPALRTAGRLPHSVAQQSFFQVDYSSDPLMTDPGFRHRLMVEVCKAGLAIEQALGSAQVGGREGLAACLVPGAGGCRVGWPSSRPWARCEADNNSNSLLSPCLVVHFVGVLAFTTCGCPAEQCWCRTHCMHRMWRAWWTPMAP